jgi:hypothetical protein
MYHTSEYGRNHGFCVKSVVAAHLPPGGEYEQPINEREM